ncbi:MAG: DegT/DnrJ/EryC1/StrS aminotransferase family protein, partial [Candidatus Omnitrophica bacterium]|nr:DegT/DnrJ/EryC1/StrS aminotransferase family protein [Candidatus Omnitrophota bacterium]
MRIIPRQVVDLSCQDITSIVFPGRVKKEDIARFEKAFAAYIGKPYALVMPTARLGLACLLEAMEWPQGSEIIVAALNYHVVPYVIQSKGLTPVFVDINSHTNNIDPDLIEAKITAKTRAVLVTHLFGRAAPAEQIRMICDRFQLFLIEDVAQACGAERQEHKLGSFGDAALFSFGQGKILTTLRGGMVLTDDPIVLQKVKQCYQQLASSRGVAKESIPFKSVMEWVFTQRLFFALVIYPLLVAADLLNVDLIDRLSGDCYSPKDARPPVRIKP